MYYHCTCTTTVHVLPLYMHMYYHCTYYHYTCTTTVHVLPLYMYYHCTCTTTVHVLPLYILPLYMYYYCTCTIIPPVCNASDLPDYIQLGHVQDVQEWLPGDSPQRHPSNANQIPVALGHMPHPGGATSQCVISLPLYTYCTWTMVCTWWAIRMLYSYVG